ncbi:fibronectin type III domain-containing protein [Flavobacterium psychrophilum]|uniref:fibronectin type III domain-containing protein n=2 Tax=Flavobacterium psychrophilum TaxID=96345 RepID=UPI000B7C3443|nr:fibronectin type III domain-containing protein [Flavobacterium psychrophilum]EKT4499156.1 fibronectin type III domain-containing protein [Flavobacterium psychrophilum]EKT4552046.1 fibronectin type III domain-containing protein [Flavobacterium psychrophilum]ELM3650815.1 fibronectin type III domain-containing protein [Flavobacterium psychrophilum]ELM3671469.1 fibronectin type III domain-containing protein [Flavobacterium psychrophilum]ELM3726003.1 fibronectin type III domain-containing protei
MFFLIFSTLNCFSQTTKPEIKVIARGHQDKVMLRWGITSPSEWKKSLKTGFVVTRYTVKKANQILSDPEKKIITLKPLLPEPLEKWSDLIQKDNYAAIVAQSIYGEDFQITGQNNNSISKIIDSADELEQRHTFGLFAADMSFEGSLKAGWALIDNTIIKNEVYVYQVSLVNNTKIKPASVMVGVRDYKKLPAVEDLIAVSDDKKVIISWDFESYKNIFTSYKIERSDDGVEYKSITNAPIVNMNEQKGVQSKRLFYVDTLAQNDKTYHYKLYGISAFGEKGQASKVFTAKGIHDVFLPSRIENYKIAKDNSVVLEWEYPKELENHIAGFEINHSEDDKGPYQKVSEILLSETRHFEYKNLAPSNYFKVIVVGKNNKRLNSQSTLVQPIDSIAPIKPIGLEGVMDSLGNIKIIWKANLEKDLLGYRILKANNENEEFVDIYKKSYQGIEYKDKVSLTMSNSKVYYRIAAEDKRFNISEMSDVLVLEKPDVIPPAAPIFKNYNVAKGKVYLQWIRSYSDDVVSHHLQRKKNDDKVWTEILKVNDTIQEFYDTNLENKTTYQYAIVAKDKTGLISSLDNSIVTVQFIDMTSIAIMQNLIATVDREQRKIILTWDYKKSKEKIKGLSIYKNKTGEAPTLWKEITKPIIQIEDNQLSMNTDYEYHFVINLESNNPTKPESLTVKY